MTHRVFISRCRVNKWIYSFNSYILLCQALCQALCTFNYERDRQGLAFREQMFTGQKQAVSKQIITQEACRELKSINEIVAGRHVLPELLRLK